MASPEPDESAAEAELLQQRLRQTEAGYRELFENNPLPMWIYDLETLRFLAVNDAAIAQYGWSREEFLAMTVLDIRPPADVQRLRNQLDVITDQPLTLPTAWTHLRKDGSQLSVTITSHTIIYAGRPARVTHAHDITELLALEQKLARSQRLEAIGQLTGGIAHDFNNLLTVILSNAEFLTEQLEGNAELRVLAEMTRTAAERGAELTRSLLAFARRQTLEPQNVNINKLVVEMDRLLRRTLGENIEIELIQGAGLWQAIVDPVQLESAILNLALNARDAMPEGGKLTIETTNSHIDLAYSDAHEEVTPGQYVLVCVSDTGTGMSPEVAARAFDPFFSTKEVGKGTGLGLSMVYGFVKQSGGHIKIYSEVGHGTLFKIYLPRSADQKSEVKPPATRRGEPVGTETILLVEDDELVRAHAERVLRALGYDILVANNGAAAMAILERGDHVDLLFTDIVMPGGMGGRQLAEKATALRPSLKVLFTSGYTENAVVHHGRLDPGVHLIRKPYRKRELALKLREVLGPSAA